MLGLCRREEVRETGRYWEIFCIRAQTKIVRPKSHDQNIYKLKLNPTKVAVFGVDCLFLDMISDSAQVYDELMSVTAV